MKEVSKQQLIIQIQSHKSKMYLENVLPQRRTGYSQSHLPLHQSCSRMAQHKAGQVRTWHTQQSLCSAPHNQHPYNTMPKHHKHRSQGTGFCISIYTYTYRHRVWRDLAMILVSSVCFPSLLKPLHSGNSLDDYHQVNKNLYVGNVGSICKI